MHLWSPLPNLVFLEGDAIVIRVGKILAQVRRHQDLCRIFRVPGQNLLIVSSSQLLRL